MIKYTEIDFRDTNVANIGSDLDKKLREQAAQTETAWAGAGKAPGLQIWRIEQFKVVAWPKQQYGSFFSGDSYIILHTYKKKDNSDALAWHIHFWLGLSTTQDESGTAAYKTVELDDLLGGAHNQYREVQGYESDLFLSYFNSHISIMEGGAESGFKHVEPEKYRPRLLHLKGKKKFRITEVPMSKDSLNSGDTFILDAGLTLYLWNGKSSSAPTKFKGNQIAKAISEERRGVPKVVVFAEGDVDDEPFWEPLGGKGPIKSAQEATDLEVEKNVEKVLFELTDEGGKMEFKLIAKGKDIKKSLLDSKAVFVFDVGFEVITWIGSQATVGEKKLALSYAQQYIKDNNRPSYLPVCRMIEGAENEVFTGAFAA